MTSSALQAPSLIRFSLTTAISVIIAIFLTSLIRRGSCFSLDGVVHEGASGYHSPLISSDGDHVSTSALLGRSRDELHPMRLGRGLTRDVNGTGQRKFPCFNCVFKRTLIGYRTGSEDCQDPFAFNQMPEVMCVTSCFKMVEKSDGDMTIHRGCSPKCVEKVEENFSNHCCRSRLCNSSTSLNSVFSHVTVVVFYSTIRLFS